MPRRFWNALEEAYLVDAYPDTPTAELALALRRPVRAIYQKALALGLKKSPSYLASPHACRLRRGDDIGASHRFQPGAKPWNAGLKGWTAGGRSAEQWTQSATFGLQWLLPQAAVHWARVMAPAATLPFVAA